MPRRTPTRIREAAVRDFVAGESCIVVGERYGISPTTVSKWAIKDAGYQRERWQREITIDPSPEVYTGGWVNRGGVMRPLEPVRGAG